VTLFRHGQPAKVVDIKHRENEGHIGSYGRLYESTVPGRGAYIWIVGTAIRLDLEDFIVEHVTEHELTIATKDTRR